MPAAKAQYSALALRYDALMDDCDYERWCDFYCEIAGLSRGAQLLEAACGTGLMTQRLLKRGMKVTATDISEEMLAAAGERLRSVGGRCALARMDMRELEIHKPCDAVLCACDGVNYLTSGADVFFERARECLKPGGVLAFDISSHSKLAAMDGQFYYDDRDDETCFWTGEFDSDKRALTLDVSVFVRTQEGHGAYKRYDEQHRLRAYKADEIERLLYKSGFKDINTYGDYIGDEPLEVSKRLHFTAKK